MFLFTGGQVNDDRMTFHLLQRPASTGAAAVQLAPVDGSRAGCSPLASSEFLCPPFYEEANANAEGPSCLTHLLEFQPAPNRGSSVASRHRGVMMRKQHSVSCANQCCQQKL
jgi:hypothetical protein